MTNKQKMNALRILLDEFQSYLNEQEKKSYNNLNHKFAIPQISNSTYLLEFHKDRGDSVEKYQFLSFQDPMHAKHYIQALFNLMTINESIYHESTMFEVMRLLTNNKAYL